MKELLIISLLFTLLACKDTAKREIKGKEDSSTTDSLWRLASAADSFYNNDEYRNAILCFDTLILMNPKNGGYFYKRGYSYGMLLERQKAVEDYIRAAALGYRPDDAWYNAGINIVFDNDSLALRYFQSAIKINPNHQDALKQAKDCKKRLSRTSNF